MTGRTRTDTLTIVKRVLAADCNCEPSAFDSDSNTIVPAGHAPGRRRFPRVSDPLIVTMGRGVVISASEASLDWMQVQFTSASRDEAFSAKMIARLWAFGEVNGCEVFGPDLKYVCTPADLAAGSSTGNFALLEDSEVWSLYQHAGFNNALQYDPEHPQPDVLATVAYDNGRPIGIAGASADSEDLWQIGIDVLPGHRSTRIGFGLVLRLTRAIFERGKIPYYSTSPSNIASRRLARRVGFWPAWTEIRAHQASASSHLDD